MGWPLARLADCCTIRPLKAEAKRSLDDDAEVSFVPMNNLGINTKQIRLEENKSLGSVSGSYTYFAENDVLLAKITPCFENGKLGIANGLTNGIGFGSSEFIVFRTQEKLIPDFLYYFLLQPSFRDEGKAAMKGAVGHKRVSKEYVEGAKIPLPPIPEQKRIVAILDQAFADIDRARALTEQNLKNARELFDSTLQQVFSQRGEGWETKRLESIANIVNGYAFKSGDFSNTGALKSIKITNVGVYNFVQEVGNRLPIEFQDEYSRYRAFEGDVAGQPHQNMLNINGLLHSLFK